jgi:phage terminase large subunit-like protein
LHIATITFDRWRLEDDARSDRRLRRSSRPRDALLPRRLLIADPTTVITRGSTYDNRANLAPAFLQQIVRKYEGTRLGRQELNAEILDDVPGAL